MSGPDGLALDLGAFKVAALGTDGPVRAALPRCARAEPEVEWLTGWLRTFARPGISRVVLSSAPEVDDQACVRRWPNRPHWTGVPLGGTLAALFGVPVRIVPDGMSAGYAEACAGGLPDLLYLGLGTGVSAGVVHRGDLLLDGRQPVDLGHTLAERDGPPCTCGEAGCLQALASVPGMDALESAARRAGPARPAGSPSGMDVPVVQRVAGALATAVLNAAVTFGIGHAVLGGVLVDRVPALVPEVRRSLAELRRADAPTVRAGILGADAALLGAAVLAGQMSPASLPARPS